MSSTRSENKTKPLPPLAAVYQEPDVGSTEPEHPHLVTLAEAMSQWPDIFDEAAWTDYFLPVSSSGDSPELTQPTAESPTAPAVWVYFTPNELDALRTEYGVSNNPAFSRELDVTQRSYEHLLNQVHAISPHFSDPVSLRWLVLLRNVSEIENEVLKLAPDTQNLPNLLTRLKYQAQVLLINGRKIQGFQTTWIEMNVDQELVDLLLQDDPEILSLLQSSEIERSQVFAETLQSLVDVSTLAKSQFLRIFDSFTKKPVLSSISDLALHIVWIRKHDLETWISTTSFFDSDVLMQLQFKVILFDLQNLARKFLLLSDGPFPNL